MLILCNFQPFQKREKGRTSYCKLRSFGTFQLNLFADCLLHDSNASKIISDYFFTRLLLTKAALSRNVVFRCRDKIFVLILCGSHILYSPRLCIAEVYFDWCLKSPMPHLWNIFLSDLPVVLLPSLCYAFNCYLFVGRWCSVLFTGIAWYTKCHVIWQTLGEAIVSVELANCLFQLAHLFCSYFSIISVEYRVQHDIV